MGEEEKLSSGKIVEKTSETVKDLKNFVRESELGREDLKRLLETEKENKDRKTAREFLKKERRRIEKERELERSEGEIKDVEEVLDDLEEQGLEREEYDLDAPEIIDILSASTADIESRLQEKRFARTNLEEILEAEKNFKDRESVKELIKDEIRYIEELEDVKNAERDVEELEELIERLKDRKAPSSQISEEKNSSSDEKETEDQEDKQEKEKSSEETEEDADGKDLETMIDEKPGEVLDKVEEMSIEDIEKITFEEKLRDELIEDLSEDFSGDKLRKVSTRDLIKLRAEAGQKEKSKDSESKNEDEKDKDEIEEEAEEDLQMLMGAGKSEESEKESESRFSGISEFKDNIKDKIRRGEDEEEVEEESAMSEDEIRSKLEDYSELPRKEAVIKTAHVMKGYLEYKKNVERELTYKELADRISDSEEEGVRSLAKYFKKMGKDEYTGKVDIDGEEMIEKSKETLNNLS